MPLHRLRFLEPLNPALHVEAPGVETGFEDQAPHRDPDLGVPARGCRARLRLPDGVPVAVDAFALVGDQPVEAGTTGVDVELVAGAPVAEGVEARAGNGPRRRGGRRGPWRSSRCPTGRGRSRRSRSPGRCRSASTRTTVRPVVGPPTEGSIMVRSGIESASAQAGSSRRPSSLRPGRRVPARSDGRAGCWADRVGKAGRAGRPMPLSATTRAAPSWERPRLTDPSPG